MNHVELTPASVDAVQAKLQDLFESLPHEERPVLETLLTHAAQGARQARSHAPGEETSIIIVGGKTGGVRIPLNPAVVTGGTRPSPPVPPPDSSDARFVRGED